MYAFYTLYSLSPVRARAPRCGVALYGKSIISKLSISVSQRALGRTLSGSPETRDGDVCDVRPARRDAARADARRRGLTRLDTRRRRCTMRPQTERDTRITILNTTQHTQTRPSMNKLRETQIDARRSGPRATGATPSHDMRTTLSTPPPRRAAQTQNIHSRYRQQRIPH